MAACDLKIELDDENKTRAGGDIVTGTVIVRCEKDCNCKGLMVNTMWSTHGRGNVDSGIGETANVYTGPWQADQEYRYAFKLKSAAWPPTYYGNYLNVSHSVHAQAKLPWAFDPKTEKEFPVVATSSPEDLQPKRQQIGGIGGAIGYVIVGVLLLVFGAVFIWLVPFILLIAGIVWFFKKFLPKYLTGPITADVQPQRARPGELLKGQLSFAPKRSLAINGISYKIRCIEKCVSGSGSNRTTHTYDLVSTSVPLSEPRVLPAGDRQAFEFEYSIPLNAGPSMKLSDNELLWSVELRIDIPRWPDWSKTFDLVVEPSAELREIPIAAQVVDEVDLELSADDKWLYEVLDQLEQSEDPDRLQLVLDAVQDQSFTMTLDIFDNLDDPPPTSAIDEPGVWYDAYLDRRDLSVALFVPTGMAPARVGSNWRGAVGILQYDADEELLIVKAL